jgi:hypothetical protein
MPLAALALLLAAQGPLPAAPSLADSPPSPRAAESLPSLRADSATLFHFARLSASAPPADTAVEPDTVERRPIAVEYSGFYATRQTIHKYASYAMLPLFVAQYFAGRELLTKGPDAAQWAKSTHRPIATGVTVLFGVNTVTGVWNLIEARKDPAGRTRRTVHALMMLAADAGFVATGLVAEDARESGGRRDLHQALALSSMGVATASWVMMLVWRD